MSGLSSLVSSLQTATTGMAANQRSVSVISHNIANVNNEHYSRQSVRIQAESVAGFGAGVSVSAVQRTVDDRLQNNILGQLSNYGFAKAKADEMKNIETALGNPNSNTGIDGVISSMLEQFNVLASSTDSAAQKRSTVQSAETMVNTLQTTYDQLQDNEDEIDTLITEELENLNTVIRSIFDLNVEIAGINAGGGAGSTTVDLEDERMRQLENLAQQFGVSVTYDSLGEMRVLTESGRKIVDGITYTQFERTGGNPAGIGLRTISQDGNPTGTVFDIDTDRLSTGAVKGLVDLRDTIIPNLQAELDELATTIMDTVNAIHNGGSSVPPLNSYSSTRTGTIVDENSDLYATLDANLEGESFEISVVDSTGQVIATTVGGAVGDITFDSPGPYSLQNLVDEINANTDISTYVTAALNATNDGLSITANNSNYGIVLKNTGTGDALTPFGFNDFFTGTSVSDMAVRSDIASTPERIATARMRDSDGGLSLLDNRNVLLLASLVDDSVSFDAAGGLAAQNDGFVGYANSIVSNFSIELQFSNDREEFNDLLLTELKGQRAEISGVNLDEELANLLVFQNAFQASARVVGVIDEMMQALINAF